MPVSPAFVGAEPYTRSKTRLNLATTNLHVNMQVDAIVIAPHDWRAVPESTQELYRRTASERGIRLEIREGGVDGGLLLMGRAEEEGRSFRHLAPIEYYGVIRCRRLPWEHALRAQLGLWDPCFPPNASNRS